MRSRADARRVFGCVLVCFVVAGALLPLWERAAGRYTGALVVVCRPIVRWVEPAPLVAGLVRSGTIVRLASDLSPGGSLGAVETSQVSFYLPFVVLLLIVGRWYLDVISLPEILLVLGALFVVHIGCLSLSVQNLEVDSLVPVGSPALVGPFEQAILRTLHHTYCYSGAQLWSGLVVALVLFRAGTSGGRSDRPSRRWGLSRALAAACVVLVLPAMLYLAAAPAVRQLTGQDRRARATAARAYLRAGDRETSRRLAEQAFDASHPDPGVMQLLGAIAEEPRPAEASEWYRKVLASRPGYLGARLGLARAQMNLGHREAAMATYYSVLSIAPEHAGAYRALGDLYHERGDREAARAHYELAARFQPGPRDPRVRPESPEPEVDGPVTSHDR